MYPVSGSSALISQPGGSSGTDPYAENEEDMMYSVNAIQGRPPSHHRTSKGISPYVNRSYVRAGVHGGLGGGARRVPLNASQPNNELRFNTSMWFDAEDRSKYAMSSGTMTVPYTGEVLRTYHRKLIPGTTHRHKNEPSRDRGRAGRGLEFQRRAETRRGPKRTRTRAPPRIQSGRAVPHEIAENSRSMVGMAARSLKMSILSSGDHEGPLRQSDRAGSLANVMDYRKPFDASVSRFVDPKLRITKRSGTRDTRKQIAAPGSSSAFDRRALPEKAQRMPARRTAGARPPTAAVRKRIMASADSDPVRFGGSSVAATGKVGRAAVPMRTSGARPPRAPVVGGIRRGGFSTSGAPRSHAGAPIARIKGAGAGTLRQAGTSAADGSASSRTTGGGAHTAAGGALLIKGPPQPAAVNPRSGLRGTSQALHRPAVRVLECTCVRGPPPTFETAGRRFSMNVTERLGRVGVGSVGQVPASAISLSVERDTSRGIQKLSIRDGGSGNLGITAGDTSGAVMRQGAALGFSEKNMGKGGAVRGTRVAVMRDGGSGNPGVTAGDTSGAVMRQGAALGFSEKNMGKGGAARGTQQSEATARTLSSRTGSSAAGDSGAPVSLRTGVRDSQAATESGKARGTMSGGITRGLADRAMAAPPSMADGTNSRSRSTHGNLIRMTKPKTESRGKTDTTRVSGPVDGSLGGSAPPMTLINDSSVGRVKKELRLPRPGVQGMEAVRGRTGALDPSARWASALDQHKA